MMEAELRKRRDAEEGGNRERLHLQVILKDAEA
jgi:hypothetical protein